MSEQLEILVPLPEQLARLEEHVRRQLTGRLCEFQLVVRDDGLILRGHARSYYAKQLAQHAVLDATNHPIRANEIKVS